MKTSKILYSLAAIALAQVSLQAVETNPVGFVSVTVPANSDAILAVPLNRAATFTGVVNAVAGNVITVTGTPGWTANQLIFNGPGDAGTDQLNTYALQLASGAKEGLIGKITAHGTGTNPTVTLTLDAGDDLTGILAGDQFDIMPYWTPGSLFSSAPPTATELFGFDTAGAGKNLGASEIYGYTGSAWEDGVTGDPATDTPLRFGSAYIVRNNSGAAFSLSMVGAVPMSKVRIRLSTLANNVDQDIQLGYSSPVPESVISLGLPAVAGDAIIGFDNSAIGKNKGAATIYAFDGTQWVDDITGDPLDANTKLQPGFGYIYRKLKTATPQTVVWSHLQSYLQ
jgi:uncharacterized protein (TIGR02597 family)